MHLMLWGSMWGSLPSLPQIRTPFHCARLPSTKPATVSTAPGQAGKCTRGREASPGTHGDPPCETAVNHPRFTQNLPQPSFLPPQTTSEECEAFLFKVHHAARWMCRRTLQPPRTPRTAPYPKRPWQFVMSVFTEMTCQLATLIPHSISAPHRGRTSPHITVPP